MKNFLFLFRADQFVAAKGSPEEMQATTQSWMDWIGSIAAQNNLVDRGNRLNAAGKVVRPNNVVTDGPYTEIKETLGGYTLIKAASMEEAVEIAKGCPIYKIGGNVEVREIDEM
ncbi:MAG TPA: YciI family protein [Chitinophaga sp.]|uniref:YciI family protein n=1 Tax=Chitinophaga sp. TaxID=1869181 RepID=UPI002BF58EFC|nr:YciI family protein [Chitinophaga sp.]HVI44183.1 YciI family protein [Chitinophaga sp.]